jgi:SWI/SNF-related matrix-associated actin-dependent regulator of chromatin subfamily A3
VAAKLARYMDNGWLFCEGRLAGEKGTFDCPLTVNLMGPDPRSEAGRQLITKMVADKLPTNVLKTAEREEKERQKELERQRKQRAQEEKRRLAEERKAAAGAGRGGRAPSSSQTQTQWSNPSMPGTGNTEPAMEDLLEMSQRFNPRESAQAADNYGLQGSALEQMPKAPQPASIKTDMLPYQLQALQWLLDQENPQLPPVGSKDAVQLWKRDEGRANVFTNLASNFSTQQPPVLASGGILADDMGLGKTLEMISLLAADREKNGKGITLIVSPLSVISNWTGQISRHIKYEHALQVYVYRGAGRVKMQASDFEKCDVVVTTYQTLASDYMPKGKRTSAPERKLRPFGLYSVDWRRVILDEGHQVRNPKSKGAAAVTALIARSRWVLTGTPIVNNLKDLYSLLRFIGITGGLEQSELFNQALVRPLKADDPSATLLLQAVMKAFTLRRRKEMKFVDLRLPKLDEYVHRIEFTPKERERYLALNAQAQDRLQIAKDGGLQQYTSLLEILLRMRQCCNHWQLCGERVTNLMAQLTQSQTVDLNSENVAALQDVLQVSIAPLAIPFAMYANFLHQTVIESQEDCAICLETLHEPVITPCGHSFGQDCIARVIEVQHKCPMCRADLKDDSVLVGPRNEGGDEEADDEMDLTQSSSKLEGLMKILSATKTAGEGEKTVVFSQWTRFLDIVSILRNLAIPTGHLLIEHSQPLQIQARLDREGYKYCRLDGTMSVAERDDSLNALDKDANCTIMLASLSACAVGLNLTAANQIILSDTWWAPAIEDQAVDRVHRLGQTEETRVFRLVIEGSIEETTIQIQQDKRKLMQLAFSEREGTGKREKAKTSRWADIQRLLSGPALPGEAGR